MELRACHIDDLDAVLQTEAESFDQPYDRVVFQDFLARRPDGFLVAETDQQIVGYAIFALARDRGLIVSIAVAPPYRRRGTGSRLLEAALHRLCAKRDTVELQVGVTNTAAIGFYRQHGFEVAGRIPHYYGDAEDAYLMRRSCAPNAPGKR